MATEKASVIMGRCYLVQLLLVSWTMTTDAVSTKPNILFFLLDDWGFGDASWSLYPEIPTPRMAELKAEGLYLSQFYTQPKCTPGRAALMTARYPYKMGMQTKHVFTLQKNNTLDPTHKILPQYLKDLGYTNHMVGKWHLGDCNNNTTPIGRGFDSHYGTWANVDDYFTHMKGNFYSWFFNNEPLWEASNTYNTHLMVNRTQTVLTEHFTSPGTADDPLFLYVAFNAPHLPAQVPEKYINETSCKDLPYDLRKTYCGMVAAIDEGVGNVTDTLRQLGVLDDFIIILTSDNGGAINVEASNWPLRGNKQTVYEGGTRAHTLVRAPKFLDGRTGDFNGLVHMTDMLPTLVEAAGGRVCDLPEELDGQSVWKELKYYDTTRRKYMVYNIDPTRKLGAIRLKNRTHNFKLVYHETDRVTGYRSQDPRPANESAADPRDRFIETNGVYYRLFDLSTNPEEREPSTQHPDAALSNPDVLDHMKDMLDLFTLDVVERPNYGSVQKTKINNPNNPSGPKSFAVSGC